MCAISFTATNDFRSKIKIRNADSVDLDPIMHITTRAFDPRFGEGWTLDQFTACLAFPNIRLIVAEASRIFGFLISRTILDETEVLLFAVDPDSQRKGVGRMLLSTLIAEARQACCQSIFLEARASNPAVSLYKCLGFVPVGRRPNYYHGSDASVHDALTFRYKMI